MKKILLTVILLIVITKVLISQKIDTSYFDKNWNQTTSSNYKFYRIAKQNSNIVEVADYYRSNQIQMTGAYTSFEFSEEIGPFYYYKKGKVYHLQLYHPSNYPEILEKFLDQLKYINVLPDTFSLNVFFDQRGRIKSVGYRIDECNNYGTWIYFVGNSKFPSSLIEYQNNIRHGRYIYYDNNGVPAISGEYKFGKKEGAWEWSKDGKVFLTDYWMDGKKIKTIR
jgi:hypothetical protein